MSDEHLTGVPAVQENASEACQARPRKFPWPQFILTMIVAAMVAYALHMVLTAVIPEGNQRIADIVLGYLMGVFSTACAFWFNTTHASEHKTDLLSQAQPVDPR